MEQRDARELELAQRYKPLLVLYPEIEADSRERARNQDWRKTGDSPISQDYHPRDVRLILDHARLGRRTSHDADTLVQEMNRRPEAERIRYHQGMPTPRKAWRSYHEIVAGGGIHRGHEYPYVGYAHFVHGDGASVYAGLVAIQYWFIYYYNDWKASHAGDWEHIVVFLKETTGDSQGQLEPIACAYSAHHGGYRLRWQRVERVDDQGNLDRDNGNHPVVYVASGSHANYFFGPSRYATSTEVLGARITAGEVPIAGSFTDFTTSLEAGFKVFPEVRVVPTPGQSGWTDEWAWLNFRGKWGSKGMAKWKYYLGFLRGHSVIGEAPGSLPDRSNWSDPFGWADRE